MFIDQLFTLETLPSTLVVLALVMYAMFQYRKEICGDDETNMCAQFLKNGDVIAMISSGAGLLLMVCICMGFITLSGPSAYGGGYGGGYGMW